MGEGDEGQSGRSDEVEAGQDGGAKRLVGKNKLLVGESNPGLPRII